jgi:hypothetical protein
VLLTPVALAAALLAATGAASAPTDPDSGAPTPFERSLGRVPAAALDAEGAMVTYVDMDLAWERAGVGTDPSERLDRISALVELPTWTQPPQLFAQTAALADEARAEVGFSMFEIEREIAVLAPPRNVMIAETAVTPEDVDTAVGTDLLWSSELTTVEHAAGTYFQWGDDPAAPNVDRISPLRPLGQGGQLAVLPDEGGSTVVRTLDAADMEAVLTTVAGGADSLLDTDFFAAVLPALGDGDVLQATSVQQPLLLDPAVLVLSTEAIEEVLESVVLVPPYRGLVIAELYGGRESHAELLFVYGDAASADESVALFEQALAENINLTTREPVAELFPDATVSAEGSVVVVSVPSQDAYRVAQRMLFERALFPVG